MPHPTVRQLTARRFREDAAMMLMKQMMPATAWTRGLTAPRKANAAPPSRSAMAAAMSRRPLSDTRYPLHDERPCGFRRILHLQG
jgi:hypothetical protein